MIKVLFKSVLRTDDFMKSLDDFIEEAGAEFPELNVADVGLINVGGTSNIIKLVMVS